MVEEARRPTSRRVGTDRRREISRRKRNVSRQRLAQSVIGLFVLVIAGIIVAAFVMKFVLPSKHLVVSVDDVKFTRGDMVRELRVKQQSSGFLGRQFQTDTEIFKTFSLLVENEVIKRSAPKLKIAVSDKEVDESIRGLLGATVDEALGKDADQLERDFRERYKGYLRLIRLGEGEHREFMRKSLLREKLRQFIGESVPSVAKQVHLHRMTMSPDAEVNIMRVKFSDAVDNSTDPEKLKEAFKEIIREFGVDDPETARQGGDLQWVPEDVFPEYDAYFFDLEVGELSEPVPRVDAPNTVFFFMVSERDEARDIDAASREVLKTRALQNWVNDERSNYEIFADFNSEIYSWVVQQLRLTAITTPTPAAGPFGF